MSSSDLEDDILFASFDVEAAIQNRRDSSSSPAKKMKWTTKEDLVSDLKENTKPVEPVKRLEQVVESTDGPLEATLQSYFGYSKFRPGQKQVLEAVLQKRDVAVFWATGAGKSLCYQIPALHTKKTVLVVSPLISLMQDQCNKLNGLVQDSEPLAAYLGTAQNDPLVEQDVLRGKYRVVYVTPEKLVGDGFFLGRLSEMHRRGVNPLCLIAIDESHCVSEWGHDFRPSYRQLDCLRRGHLADVPLMCLTATAVPRVQKDIVKSLQLKDPLVAIKSFDRTNLNISVKKRGPVSSVFISILPTIKEYTSTIVYAATRDQVEEITSFLSSKMDGVEAYHAGLSSEQRKRSHINFLVGRTRVIVATVAFGMGIDKPDTRCVVHFGPPKTVEEYYQQIGRAGRDGLVAECIMFASDSDFDKYKSDFYIGGLEGKAKEATVHSIDSLRKYAFDIETCRRKALLNFFEEVPSFGERCGTCDTCKRIATYGNDSERDLGAKGARMVLTAVDAVYGSGMTVIEKVLGGNVVEAYRYKRGCNPHKVQQEIQEGRANIGMRVSASYFRDLVVPLVSKGYIEQGTSQATVNGFSRSWATYAITPKGRKALDDPSLPIMLPVPDTIREIERKEEERRQRVLAQLDEAGVKIDQLPKKEVEDGDGEVIRAFTKWHNYVEIARKNGREDRVAELESLLERIKNWRSETASKHLMAPAAVLAEHTVALMAYTIATMKPGLRANKEAIMAAGVRTRELDSLVNILNTWLDEVAPVFAKNATSSSDALMILPEGLLTPAKSWEYAVYKPVKKTGLASWESSYDRFVKGEHPQSIAIAPANGKPIQVGTVVGHIMDGFVLGRSVPLHRLVEVYPPPTKTEWEKLEECEATTGMSVVGDPETSGLGGDKFRITDLLRPIMGGAFCDTPFNERSPEDKEKFGKWCDALKWYMALRRVGYEPSFEVKE